MIKKTLKLIGASTPIVLFLVVPQIAFGATGATEPSQKLILTIPASASSQWRGSFTITQTSTLRYGSWEGLDETIKAYIIGSKTTEKNKRHVYIHDPYQVYTYIKANSAKFEAEPQDPVLEIINDRAVKFVPPKNGWRIDLFNSTKQALASLEKGSQQIELIGLTKSPRKSLAETNDLGITELISEGESNFSGSPSNRRHNIKIGVEKTTGIIVKPGNEFSFNHYLGPVEASEGFLPELVIKADLGTIPELGGGLCQVSSTTFRAAVHAGLPITQRRNHSYAVGYYAPQGTDATIYPGVIDLKFKNDTDNSILIWAYIEGNKVYYDFYGTKDSRQIVVKDPVQYDKKSDGSLKASWTRIITRNGVSETDTFNSNYKPPALFHRETKYVDANGNTSDKPDAPVPTPEPQQPTPPTPATPLSNQNPI